MVKRADQIDFVVLETKVEEKHRPLLTSHSKTIWDLLFLPDGTLASCSQDETIKIWDTDEGRELYELKDDQAASPIYSLASLPNDSLASGSWRGSIQIWNLSERKMICTLKGHAFVVVSLKVIKDGLLVSCSLDETIKIWNPFSSDKNLLLTIKDHGNASCLTLRIGVLSNEYLVSCTRDFYAEEDALLNVWNSNTGLLVKSVSTRTKDAKYLLALSDDTVAVIFKSGTIKLFDMVNESKTRTIERAREEEFISINQLSNGTLVTSSKERTILSLKVWNMNDLSLVQSMSIKNFGSCLLLNSSAFLLAAVCDEKVVKTWKLNNELI